jgi:hypothetical protein
LAVLNEARRDTDVGDVGDPELIGADDDFVLGQIAEDWIVVVAVRRRHIPPTHAWLEIVFAHEAPDLLVIDHDALLAKGGLYAPPTVAFDSLQMALIASKMAVSSGADTGAS